MFCPVATAQSTSFSRSWNSPTPKLSSVRREKTGTAVPAPRQGRDWKAGTRSFTTRCVPLAGTSAKRWFGPSSQRTIRPFSTRTNLNSKGFRTSSVMLHQGKRLSSSRMGFDQSASVTIAAERPGRTWAAGMTNVTFPPPGSVFCVSVRKERPSLRRKTTSLKAEDQKAESAGRSVQRSRTVTAPAPSGARKRRPRHSRRTTLSFRTTR